MIMKHFCKLYLVCNNSQMQPVAIVALVHSYTISEQRTLIY